MRYPIWFPYPKCWLKSVGSFLLMIPVIVFYKVTKYEFLILPKVIVYPHLFSKERIIGLIVAEIIIPSFIIAHTHQFLFGNPHPRLPRIIPHPKSMLEGFCAWMFPVLCIWAIGFFLLYFFDSNIMYVDESNSKAKYLMMLVVSLIAYCYHIRFLIEQTFLSKAKKRSL